MAQRRERRRKRAENQPPPPPVELPMFASKPVRVVMQFVCSIDVFCSVWSSARRRVIIVRITIIISNVIVNSVNYRRNNCIINRQHYGRRHSVVQNAQRVQHSRWYVRRHVSTNIRDSYFRSSFSLLTVRWYLSMLIAPFSLQYSTGLSSIWSGICKTKRVTLLYGNNTECTSSFSLPKPSLDCSPILSVSLCPASLCDNVVVCVCVVFYALSVQNN